jgi:hypothetical protein
MSGLSRTLVRTAAAAVVTLSVVGRVDAAIIAVDNANPQNIPGLTGFITTGASMDGMSVTAHFKSGFSETLIWGSTGMTSGGVSGTNWSLSLTGDSFLSNWNFLNDHAGKLIGLTIDGSTGLTVFDKRGPHFGTDGSFSGLDFRSSLDGESKIVKATYRNPVGINGADAVGDVFHILDLDFSGLKENGTHDSFTFVQDADNDSRIVPDDVTIRQAPEPTVLALFGLALLGVAHVRRRVRA